MGTFIITTFLALVVTFVEYIIGFAVITFLIDGVFTIADVIIILWIAAQIAYAYVEYRKGETEKE